MSVIIAAKGDVSLSTVNGFYCVEAYNLGCFNVTSYSLASDRFITVTFANPGNCRGIVIMLSSMFNSSTIITKSVTIELQEKTAPSVWITRATITKTAASITNNSQNTAPHGWVIPFEFLSPYPVDVIVDKWRFRITQSAGNMNWGLVTSNGSAAFYAAWCDNQLSFANNDTIIARDKVMINQTATFRGILGTGEVSRSICAVACTHTDPTPDNVARFVWQNPPAAPYMLTLDGIMVLGCHSGFRVGTETLPIPFAQKADIILKSVPTFGTVGMSYISDPVGTLLFNTYSATRKTSLFLYGTPPTVRSAVLAANANSGQKNIITTSATGWTVGQSLYVGKANLMGAVGLPAIYTIQSIAGVNIELNANLNFNRLAGGDVILLDNYGIVVRVDTPASYVHYMPIRAPSNVKIVGCLFVNIRLTFGFSYGAITALDEIANITEWEIKNCAACYLANDSNYFLYLICGSQLETLVDSVYAVGGSIMSVNNFQGYHHDIAPQKLIIQNCKIFWIVSANVEFSSSNQINIIFIDNVIDGIGSGSVSFRFQGSNFSRNRIRACDGYAVRFMVMVQDNTIEDNYVDFCVYGLSFYNSYVGEPQRIGRFYMGQSESNIYDLLLCTGISTQDVILKDFISSLNKIYNYGILGGTTDVQYGQISDTFIKCHSFGGITNNDLAIGKKGVLTKTGTGLADTTCHTPGGYAMRFEPKAACASLGPLRWVQTVQAGNLANIQLQIGVWVKINAAAFYSGTHIKPTLKVFYDNGSEISDIAIASMAWQKLQVSFTPLTTWPEIKVIIEGMTDQTIDVNRCFYVDDLSIDFPGDFYRDLGNMDFWFGLPCTPSLKLNRPVFFQQNIQAQLSSMKIDAQIKILSRIQATIKEI